MEKFRYKLTLEVETGDSLSKFETENSFDSCSDMEDIIPHDIARALKATMNSDECPSPLALAGAMEGDVLSIVAGLAYARDRWNSSFDFEDCLKVVIDVGKLLEEKDEIKEIDVSILSRCGIEVI